MKHHHIVIPACLLLGLAATAQAQTSLELSGIIPGTEKVQLVYNGDFQADAGSGTNSRPESTGWSRQGEMFLGAGKNTTKANGSTVAQANVSSGTEVCLYQRNVSLSPNTEYVLSAYVWNFGDEDNQVTTVIDLNDAPDEPQMLLGVNDENAAQGYFVYSNFKTSETGSNVTVRVFSDNGAGKGTALKYYPISAQWDNVAITKASDFEAPKPKGMSGNLRPTVSISSPADDASVNSSNVSIKASAADSDGSVSNVTFFAGSKKLGTVSASPYTLDWTNATSGAYQLTAVATDNKGATTVSAPVAVTVSAPAAAVVAEKKK